MRIFVVGSGGREHALVWKIAQSKLVDKIFCAPGNGGISQQAECVDIKADDVAALAEFARREHIDLTVVGPEGPLALGIVDEFGKQGLRVFGPNRKAAQLEASKVFAKELMLKYKVPTARCAIFDTAPGAIKYIEQTGAPCVVKADGLAAGKGVIVARTVDEARQAVVTIMQDKVFGSAGNKVIIEECLIGQEASIIVLTDSKGVIPLVASQDHKRIFDHDQGPNTGGMGAYSPAPIVTEILFKEILDTVIYRTIDGLSREGIEFKGALYAGIMLTKDGPKTLEFNARFGDPETEVIMPRVKSDIVEALLAVSDGRVSKFMKSGGLNWDSRACVCVVCAAKGYPGEYAKGKVIAGLDTAAKMKDVVVFHAGTRKDAGRMTSLASGGLTIEARDSLAGARSQDADYVTNGGRVLGVTGLGNTIQEAIDTTYKAVGALSFEGMQFRRDIGRRTLDS